MARLAAVLPPTAPLDSGLRRNDDWGAGWWRCLGVVGASSPYSRFDPHPSPLPRGEGDRRYRPGTWVTDGRRSERPGLISLTGATYPGSESGTCFRARLAAVLPPTAPLDSGLRRNDDWGAGWWRCLGVVGASSPYSRFDPHPSPLPRGEGDRRYRPGTWVTDGRRSERPGLISLTGAT